MRLVCISDTHNAHKTLRLPDGDVLIHAGDATSQGLCSETEKFLDWLASQAHPHKILIAGNHDWLFERHPDMAAQLLADRPGITYLQDSGVEIQGFKFWGSPWQPWFCDWAFNLPRKGTALRETWNRIPLGTDVLITHGPPYGVRDQVHGGQHLGCEELKIRLASVRPRVHIFGHIHDSYGVARSSATTYVNACSCDEQYRLSNPVIVLDVNHVDINVHGTEPNDRVMHLTALQTTLDLARGEAVDDTSNGLLLELTAVLNEMARLRGMSPQALHKIYIDRGLRSDLAKLLKAEQKPGKRSVPLIQLGDGHDEG